ncbi:MAG TPA: flagellar basal body P-ring formation chaperone FlgA [Bryobacteraceae bacterium]|jgi:flagella basal body P-ring formation protein FlgA|nr:flagellar basal body P-ring formation chaperone FlgA [Bryobacteraceae bacterium]
MIPWFVLVTMMGHPACQIVSGEQIFGADLANALPVFAAMPRDTVIGYSPAPGARRFFQIAELKRIGASYGIPVPNDSRACFEWKLRRLTEDAVRSAIREGLKNPEARVEVLAMSNAPAPEGTLVFPPSGLTAATNTDPSTAVTWKGYILYQSPRRFFVWARVRMAATMTRVITVKGLAAGKPVEKDQVRIETFEDFPLRNDTARTLEEVIGRMSLRPIRAGLPIRRSDLAEAFQVERGDMVDVTVVSGAAQLELQAVAEASGRQGDVICLRNPGTGKLFRARIEAKGRALVMVGAAGLLARVQ